MNKEFKVGDLVYEVDRINEIRINRLKHYQGEKEKSVRTSYSNTYYSDGKPLKWVKLPSLFHANEETYEALVTLYGKENVPPLPLSRHKIIVELFVKQKIVVCAVSNISYEDALNKCDYRLIKLIDENSDPPFIYGAANYTNWKYAIAVDLNGNEITEVP